MTQAPSPTETDAADLVMQLRRSAEAYAQHIAAPAIGSRPSHYLNGQAADEIERLRAALRERTGAEEVERLREALEDIAEHVWAPGALTPVMVISDMREIARKALAAPPPQGAEDKR